MNFGIIASSHGSVFKELYLYLDALWPKRYPFFVALDRRTELIPFCEQNGITYKVIEEYDNNSFSKEVNSFFRIHNVQMVLLFFVRLVTHEIYENYITLNLHPSLLPAYRGLHALENAFKENARFVGATLHRVNESVDGGVVLIQTLKARQADDTRARWQKISFLQKSLLAMIFFDYLSHDKLDTTLHFIDEKIANDISPTFYSDKAREYFFKLQVREKYRVIQI